jgi:RHS repeat-associated protein
MEAGMILPDISLLLLAPLLIVAIVHRKKGRRWSEPVATVLLAVAVVVIGMALSGGGAVPAVAVPAPMPFLSPPPLPPGCTLPTAPITGTRVISYSYDPLGRLSQAAQSDGACYQYKYDPVGNRTTLTTTAGATTYQYDAANRLTSVGGQTYTWDNAGRLTNNGWFTYTYNTAGQMTRAQGITATQMYTYNGDGLLMAKNASRYVWDVAADLPQMLSDGNTLYVPGVGQWDGKDWTYELPDGLSSVRQLADSQGYLVQRYDYGPFGEMLASEGKRANSLRYTGEQWDNDVGLLYLRARWYDPSVGRFTTRDPVPGLAGLPQTQNPYVYVNNNPINLTDPSGEIADYIWDAAMVALDVGFLASDYLYYARNPCADSWERNAVLAADWAALGIDLVLFVVPFAPGGAGLGLKLVGGGTMALARSGAHVPQVIRIGQGVVKGSQIAAHIVRSSGKPVGHHTIPKEILKKHLPQDVADAVRGKKGAPNVWGIPEEVHKNIHAGPGGGRYNERWIEEIRELKKITSEAILEMRDRLVKEFGLDPWRPK